MTRDAAAVGAGLAPARIARAIAPDERIHVIGVAGAGASAAALLAAGTGAMVSGCDAGGPSPYSPAVEAAGIPIAWAHDPRHVTDAPSPTRLAVTKALTAIAPDHPELVAARSIGLEPEPWQQVVADALVGRRLVAVAGTHGKSTTAGWLVHVLTEAGRDPSAFVGALLPAALTGGPPATARRGGGDVAIVEADEYAGNFDPYRPQLAILTGAEWDHPDVFTDGTAVEAAFEAWLRRAPDDATLVAHVGDPGAARVTERLTDRRLHVIGYALHDDLGRNGSGDVAAGIATRFATAMGPARAILGRIVRVEPASTTVEIHGLDAASTPCEVTLRTAGRHNARNALAVAASAAALGVPLTAITGALGTFPGVGRRLERKGEARGVVCYDDYGHHPTAIRETIAAVRQREPGRRLWAVYEPLTYHRTAALLADFADALSGADAVAVADIWAGRDPDTSVASAAGLAAEVARRRSDIRVGAPGSVEATADWLATQVRPGDAVLVMGGGHSYRIAERLLDDLGGRG